MQIDSYSSINSYPSENSSVSQDKNTVYNQSLEQGMNKLEENDPKLFARIMKDGQTGDGNRLVEDELQAYKEGNFTKEQVISAVSGAQSLANENGGGGISKHVRHEAKDVLGDNYIHGGQSKIGHALLNFFKKTSPLAHIIDDIKSKTHDGVSKENILQAGQGALQNGVQNALFDLENTDPDLAQKFMQDMQAKDGNKMAEDLIAVGRESKAWGGSFSDADGAMLGSQIGPMCSGKISKHDAHAFQDEFGEGTIDRGSTKASRAWNKFENGIGNFVGSVVSPLTSGVGAIDQLAKGHFERAMHNFEEAAMGIMQDAALVIAPEVAPEMAEVETAAQATRAGMTEARGVFEQSLSSMNSIQNVMSKADDMYDYANNVVNMTQSHQSA